ncbi:alpha-amylase family glycosyl hydrolase [Gaetbulibacter sp. M235]|uniref:alpha-amylase family glycosyl hydrolase n=1 Tax=Gaetbulibacter sp. M235 TaxID=3126510 RepID=UPI00374F46AC
MKKIIHIYIYLISAISFGQQQTATYSVSPLPFEETDNITITFNGNSINEATWGVADNALYIWAWSWDLNLENSQGSPFRGTWDNSNEASRLTYNAGTDTYTISFVPTTFYGRTGIGRIGFLIKAKNGTGDKKSQDILVDVGLFQVSLTAPASSSTILNTGDNLNISASNSGGNANYVLKANGFTIDTQNNISSYSYTHNNITQNQNYALEVTLNGVTKTKTFSTITDPGKVYSVMPTTYQDGITYLNDTEAILVLYATGKDFVYVAGSFNNWQPDSSYAMKIDPTRNNKFWVKLTGLIPGQLETYQYWVIDKTPLAGSPTLVKVADPYSTLVLSSYDDSGIPTTSYPNLPAYPNTGNKFEVSVLQTAQTPYNWQVTNFAKPKKEDLIVYEVLVRDFDADRNFQDLIDKVDYFKNLNINAIELMPVMEFEGNESWGYNTAFHMALDKFYGTEDKFRELIDIYHQNGIAVILDIALNHAFGRNPMVRMWMDDPDGNGFGSPTSENPYFNTVAKHAYNVGSDFNHSNPRTKDYVKRVVKHWIEDFKIDGFRWDLTKGFTQNCSASDTNCTGSYQQDRVDILKEYVDYSWSLDPTHYAIFEHLGSDTEEKEWANYRFNEGKGVMMWAKMTDQYNQLTMGFSSNSNIGRMGYKAHAGFTGNRVMGYAESHDEERLMYKNITYGNSANVSHNVKDLNTALTRMPALGAITIPIPGPKMLWHFAELGMENSIFTCTDGSVNDSSGSNGDCKLATKPQPQWGDNWLGDPIRSQIYSDWSRMIDLKINEDVFEGDYSITTSTLTPKIYIWNNALPNLKNVVILANFDVTAQNVTPDFPYTGTWYDLIDETGNTSINVTNTASPINLSAGAFKIYGNQSSTLSNNDVVFANDFNLYPNPTTSSFQINKPVDTVSIYDITGKLILKFKGGFQKYHEFNISSISQGIYIVNIKTNNSTSVSKRLIIN